MYLLWFDVDRFVHTLQGYFTATGAEIHYNDVIMSAMASQITSIAIVYSIVYRGIDHRKHQSSASLAFVREIHRWPVISPHKGPVTRKMSLCSYIFPSTRAEQPCRMWICRWSITGTSNECQDILIRPPLNFLEQFALVDTNGNIKDPYHCRLCEGNQPVTSGFPSQRVSNAESPSMSLRHHEESTGKKITLKQNKSQQNHAHIL